MATEMDWEQKRAALESLCGHLRLSASWDGRFHVDGPIEIARRGILSGARGSGETPADAGEVFWRNCTEIPDDAHIRVMEHATENPGKRMRWNGYKWAEAKR